MTQDIEEISKNLSESDMKGQDESSQEEMMLLLIRNIILKEDRKDIAYIKAALQDADKMGELVSPIIAYHLELLKKKFPETYKREVERIVEVKMKESQDELLDVIYPVMGKMIRKFVNLQIQTLRESMEERVNSIFSFKGLISGFRSKVLGVKESDMMLGGLGSGSIEEVYLIERDSGILLGHYSRSQTIDRDVVAGMLTAIKSFVEDAFTKEGEDLEMIEYGTYKIFIQSFHSYYIPIVLNGVLSSGQKELLSSKILDFAEKELKRKELSELPESENFKMLSAKLLEYFALNV